MFFVFFYIFFDHLLLKPSNWMAHDLTIFNLLMDRIGYFEWIHCNELFTNELFATIEVEKLSIVVVFPRFLVNPWRFEKIFNYPRSIQRMAYKNELNIGETIQSTGSSSFYIIFVIGWQVYTPVSLLTQNNPLFSCRTASSG